jgi:hypothetical protein
MASRWEAASMRRKAKERRSNRLKTKLGLPDLEHVKSAVLVSLRSPESQRSYRHSIDEFVAWYCSAPRLSFNKTVVIRYRISLEDRQLALQEFYADLQTRRNILPPTIAPQPSSCRGRSEQISFVQVGCEARKIPAAGDVFFLDFYLYRTNQALGICAFLGHRPSVSRPIWDPIAL